MQRDLTVKKHDQDRQKELLIEAEDEDRARREALLTTIRVLHTQSVELFQKQGATVPNRSLQRREVKKPHSKK